jgi:hypothetical protein
VCGLQASGACFTAARFNGELKGHSG